MVYRNLCRRLLRSGVLSANLPGKDVHVVGNLAPRDSGVNLGGLDVRVAEHPGDALE